MDAIKNKRPWRRIKLVATAASILILYRVFFYRPGAPVGTSTWERQIEAGNIAVAERRYQDADDAYMVALSRLSESDSSDARRPTTIEHVGALRMQQHRFAEAETFYQQAVESWESVARLDTPEL